MRPFFITIHPNEKTNTTTIIIEQFRTRTSVTVPGIDYSALDLNNRFLDFTKTLYDTKNFTGNSDI